MKRRRGSDDTPMLFPEMETDSKSTSESHEDLTNQSQEELDPDIYSWSAESDYGLMDLRDDEPEISDAETTTGGGD